MLKYMRVLTLCLIACMALAAIIWITVADLAEPFMWLGLGLALPVLGLAVFCLLRLRRRKKASETGNESAKDSASESAKKPDTPSAQPVTVAASGLAIKQRMQDAIGTIKTSKLGQLSGRAALYELPWYLLIGQPGAGKSTLIANAGLQFPLSQATAGTMDTAVLNATGDCDWHFTSEGILLDTAGSYFASGQDNGAWFGFLAVLKKYRRRAPVNGVIIAVGIDDFIGEHAQSPFEMAKNVRQRAQELTERLAVNAPVYLMFTKADLVEGFNDFFHDPGSAGRELAWGATLPCQGPGSSDDVLAWFELRFDELYEGLKELSIARMALQRGAPMAPGVFTFPLQFKALKPVLRNFMDGLFQQNPYQFKPLLRGFYFCSALQQGVTIAGSEAALAERFALTPGLPAPAAKPARHGYFLRNVLRDVIFRDKNLVLAYASRAKTRQRMATFFGASAVLGLLLGAWCWSYLNNQQLVANVQADFDEALRLEAKQADLQAHFAALEILQDRIEELEKMRQHPPFLLGLGLFQGELLERKLRMEYFFGVRQIMLKPVTQALETFLSGLHLNTDAMTAPMAMMATSAAPAPAIESGPGGAILTSFKDASPRNVEDAYNALKTYLMLGDKEHADGGHLNDQLSRFWRVWLEANRGAMAREKMIRSAERMIAFYLNQINDPAWPQIDKKRALVEQARASLRSVVRGMPARERVYADIKARASTRFPSVTVARIVDEQDKDLVLGSYAISGTFTRDAWEHYVSQAFREAARREVQSADWVLTMASREDLTLEGSPQQIQKNLLEMYQSDYAQEWQKFIRSVSIRELDGFDGAASAMNRLGDPLTSPIERLIRRVYQETSWDKPSVQSAGMQGPAPLGHNMISAWFRQAVLPQKTFPLSGNLSVNPNENLSDKFGASPATLSSNLASGAVGREFSGVARLVQGDDKDPPLLRNYMASLSRLRSRFNQIRNQGDVGPGAKQLMQQTLDGAGSELADTLKYVDEHMLAGMTEQQKQIIRPILVRPLMQTFAVIIKPTETEINKTWAAQVLQPFQKNLALKYPFAPESRSEASNAEIGQIFGPEGAIAQFFTSTIGPLVVRRGDTLSVKTWADMGIGLSPFVLSHFSGWIAPLDGGRGAGGMAAAAGTSTQTEFELQALAAPGASEYTIEIDGQQLHWRASAQPVSQPWMHMNWPSLQAMPLSRISAVTQDGHTLVLQNEPGRLGLKKMIDGAKRTRKDGGVFELSWENTGAGAGVTVRANLKIITQPMAATPAMPLHELPDTITPGLLSTVPPAPPAATINGAARTAR